MQLVSTHLTMSGWSEPISSRNSPSGESQTIWRSAARSILSLLSLHFVNVGLRRWSLSELQSIIHTLRMKRAAWYSQSVRRNTPCASAKAARSLMDSSTPSERAYVSACRVDRQNPTYDRRRVANEMHTHTVFAERVRASEKSHPPFFDCGKFDSFPKLASVTASISISFQKKSPLLKNSPSFDDSSASCNSLLANRKSSSVAVPHTDCSLFTPYES